MTFSAVGQGARVLFVCFVFFFLFFLLIYLFILRRGQILHSYSCISPVKKGQSAYLTRRGESSRLG